MLLPYPYFKSVAERCDEAVSELSQVDIECLLDMKRWAKGALSRISKEVKAAFEELDFHPDTFQQGWVLDRYVWIAGKLKTLHNGDKIKAHSPSIKVEAKFETFLGGPAYLSDLYVRIDRSINHPDHSIRGEKNIKIKVQRDALFTKEDLVDAVRPVSFKLQ